MRFIRGFTLIELLLVVSIIGLFSSFVSSTISETRDKAVTTSAVANLDQIAKGLELYYSDYGEYPNSNTYGEADPTWCSWDVSNSDLDGDNIWFMDPLVEGGYISADIVSQVGDGYRYLYSRDLTEVSGASTCDHCPTLGGNVVILIARNLPTSIPGVTDTDPCDDPARWDTGGCPGETGPNDYCIFIEK